MEADVDVIVTIYGPSIEMDRQIWVVIHFSRPVTGLERGEVTVGNGTIVNFASGGASDRVVVDILPTATGTLTVDVAAGVAVSSEGYPNAAAPTFSVPINLDRPTTHITGPTAEQSGPFDVTITFSKAVTGFEKADLSAGRRGAVTAFSGSGASYTATITPTATGWVSVTVAEGVATDLSGTFSNSASNRFGVQAALVRPTARITGPASAQSGPVPGQATRPPSRRRPPAR